jgi:Domain of unknown function (DUF4407)
MTIMSAGSRTSLGKKMAIDAGAESLAATPPPDDRAVASRPAPPSRGVGRWLRSLIGIREDVLDWLPANRPHYTLFGMIVLNTGIMAAAAMFTALTKIVSARGLALVPGALLWGWIILSIDRWLIASTHGVHHGRRFWIFAPRLVLAVLIALTIAEPLMLLIFQPALNRQVRAVQAKDLVSYESKLTTCNPVSGAAPRPGTCAGYQLSIPNPPNAVNQELSNTRKQDGQVQQEVNKIQSRLAVLRTKAQGECAGAKGPGLTGIPGVGWQCRRDWEAVTSYRDTSGLSGKLSLLRSLDQRVKDLTATASTAQATYAENVNGKIRQAVAAKKSSQRGTIGLIDEWKALEQISAQSTFVFFAHWLIWLVLIALDCLPILAKLISGATAYDRRLTRQLQSDENIYEVELRLREMNHTADKEVAIQLGEISKQERIRRIGEEERVGRAQRDGDLIAKVQELANKWIREDRDLGPHGNASAEYS